jgi:hypothetical protein
VRARSRALLVGPGLLAALLVGGCGPAATSGAGGAQPATVAAGAQVPGPTGAADASGHTTPAGGLPVSLRIPAINAQSTLVPLGLNPDRTVQVPPVNTPMQAGWYTDGPAPGEVGPAVLLGHVDGDRQEGIFFRLHVLVTRQDGSTLTFQVTTVQEVSKQDFPSQVYNMTADPELRLITCGGSFDRATHNYLDNIIVSAVLRR